MFRRHFSDIVRLQGPFGETAAHNMSNNNARDVCGHGGQRQRQTVATDLPGQRPRGPGLGQGHGQDQSCQLYYSKDKGKGKIKGKVESFDFVGPFCKNTDRTHLLRECMRCNDDFEWRRVECTHRLHCGGDNEVANHKEVEDRVGTSAEIDDIKKGRQFGERTYICVECVAERDGNTLAEARRGIKQPRTQKGVECCNKFEFAKLVIQENFAFLFVDLNSDGASTAAPSDSGWGSSSGGSESGEAAPSESDSVAPSTRATRCPSRPRGRRINGCGSKPRSRWPA